MAYAIVQTKTGSATAATSFTMVWSSNTTTGNLIVVVVGSITITVSSITDSQSNAYTRATQGNANNTDVEIWYAQNITGGTTPTITVNMSASGTASGIAQEYSGIAASAFDKAVSGTGIGGTASSGNTAATTSANELVVGGIDAGSSTPTAGSGYGNLTVNSTITTNRVGIEDKRVTATGVQAATFGGASSIWSCSVATFAESTGGATDTVSVSDSSTLTESIQVEVNSFVNKSDSVTTSEFTNVAEVDTFSVSDSSTLTENIKLLSEEIVSVNDSTTLSENTISLIPFLLINVSDSTTLTESIVMLETSFVSVSDSSTLSESVNIAETCTITVSDSTTITENIQLLSQANISVLDSSTLTESTILLVTSSISVSDTINSSESVSIVEASTISVSDSTSLTESIKLLDEDSLNVSDSSTLSENTIVFISTLLISVSDLSTLTESTKLLETSLIVVSDSVTLNESTTELATSFINASDASTLTESTQLLGEENIRVSDSTTTSESATVVIPIVGTLTFSVSDSVSLTESTRPDIQFSIDVEPANPAYNTNGLRIV